MAGTSPICPTQLTRPALHCAPCLRRQQSVQTLRRQCTAALAQANGETLLAATEAASLVSRFVELVATASPAPLQPAVNVLGMDIASTVALQPTPPGLARLAVRAGSTSSCLTSGPRCYLLLCICGPSYRAVCASVVADIGRGVDLLHLHLYCTRYAPPGYVWCCWQLF